MGLVAVIDIGKTNAKVALVDLGTMREIAVEKTPNAVRRDGPYPHHDVERLWAFILDALGRLARQNRIDAISVTTHGATAALLKADGALVLPVLDYEHDGLDATRDEYEAVRPPFAETGSPKLSLGLNIGPQLFWQSRAFPAEFARTATIIMYAQYWSFRLTGVRAGEATSLGCHTDLWAPGAADYSSLVGRMGWRDLFPPLRRASDVLGPLLPELAQATGLPEGIPVHCGIHDSNASLLPHLTAHRPPFSVASTGTWVISMAVGGRKVTLDPARDTLINVNAYGDPVPSARFMGGREFERLMQGRARDWSDGDLQAVLDGPIMLTPAVQGGSGPFSDAEARWLDGEPDGGRRFVAVSFYLAMMTATCLALIGADGPTLVEGPFAANRPYLAMLAAATRRPVAAQVGGSTGTSIGAALLAGGAATETSEVTMPDLPRLTLYADRWRHVTGDTA